MIQKDWHNQNKYKKGSSGILSHVTNSMKLNLENSRNL